MTYTLYPLEPALCYYRISDQNAKTRPFLIYAIQAHPVGSGGDHEWL